MLTYHDGVGDADQMTPRLRLDASFEVYVQHPAMRTYRHQDQLHTLNVLSPTSDHNRFVRTLFLRHKRRWPIWNKQWGGQG